MNRHTSYSRFQPFIISARFSTGANYDSVSKSTFTLFNALYRKCFFLLSSFFSAFSGRYDIGEVDDAPPPPPPRSYASSSVSSGERAAGVMWAECEARVAASIRRRREEEEEEGAAGGSEKGEREESEKENRDKED